MKHVALLILLSLPLSICAQGLWRKGEVVLKDGTRLSGFINDQEWVNNPEEIEFREEGKEIQKFTPMILQEFSTERPVKFKSVLATFDGDGQSMNNLPPLREPSVVVKDQVFLEVLVDSRYSLLYLQGKNGRKHFFIEENNEVKELIDRWYGEKQNARHYEYYKQQLTLITNDCPKLQSQVARTSYSDSNLRSFFIKLNECKGATVQVAKAGPGSSVRKRPSFGLGIQPFVAKVNYNYLYFIPPDPFSGGSGQWGSVPIPSEMSTVNMSFAAFAELYDRKRPNRLSLYNELAYQKVSQEHIKYQGINLLVAARLSKPGNSGGRHYFMFGLNNLYKFNGVLSDLPSNNKDIELENEYTLGGVLAAGKSFVIGPVNTNFELRFVYEKLHTGSTGFNGASLLGLSVQVSPKQ